jgi:transposase
LHLQTFHIMADIHIDIERMIMHSNYLLEVDNSSASNGLSDMERKQYLDQIKELVQTVQTLLDANIALGNKQKELQAEADRKIAGLQDQVDKLTGELQARRRKMHGKNNEKQTGDKSVNTGKTKDEEEGEYIENGCEQPSDSDDSDEVTDTEATNPKKDLSQRPDHYKTMKAEVLVVHDCDKDKLKAMGLEFIRYTRPVDQFDRISMTRQDRYLYAWVRDKDGNEFAFFVPKDEGVEQRACTFVDESKYDMPSMVPHTSSTSVMLSDLIVNRFQYAITSGREMYRMVNEKMRMSKSTIFNWLRHGAEFLENCQETIKQWLLKPGSTIYCDESWVDTKVTDAYAAYLYFNKLKDCTHVCCWSHVRRLFVSASRDYKDSLAQAFIDLIGILYKVEVENQVLGRTEKEIVKHRGEESLPVLHDLYQQATALLKQFEKNEIKLSAKLQQALTYMTKHWEELMAYTKIGSVLIDNNCCERAVRPFTNLRKNFGGFSSEQGARVTATFLTFVETCKLMATAPLDFFRGFFDMIVAGRRDYALMTEALLVKPV